MREVGLSRLRCVVSLGARFGSVPHLYPPPYLNCYRPPPPPFQLFLAFVATDKGFITTVERS